MTAVDKTISTQATAEQARQTAHLLMGRMVGPTCAVSFCSCGSSFAGGSVADADNSLVVHRATALGVPVTSWITTGGAR